ncbi:hypothetical protein C6A85_000000115965 [Mycobacterium sp. ITM-2017-0098]|nr:hypothetical protein C6A85_000000115965 [Mycobacterium sp. ITM-2017-0098]
MNHPRPPEHPPGQPPRPGFAPYRFPQPAPQPAPSGVTGITAAVLAGLGAVACLGVSLFGLLGLLGISALDTDSRVQTSVGIAGGVLPVLIFGIVLNVVSGVLLALGTAALARRKPTGRRLVVGGCVVTIGANLLSLGYVAPATPYVSGATVALLGLLFPIATLVLVTLPPTTTWINARRRRIRPY